MGGWRLRSATTRNSPEFRARGRPRRCSAGAASAARRHYGPRRMRFLGIVLVVALAGCGASGLEGTLAWEKTPTVSGHVMSGRVQNTTSHSVTLDPTRMR